MSLPIALRFSSAFVLGRDSRLKTMLAKRKTGMGSAVCCASLIGIGAAVFICTIAK